LDAARQALALVPRNPQAYREITATLLDNNQVDEAAVALVEGILLAPGAGIENDLRNVYQRAEISCAVTPRIAQSGSQCEPIARHFCKATPEVMRALRREGREDQAEQLRRRASQDYGCP